MHVLKGSFDIIICLLIWGNASIEDIEDYYLAADVLERVRKGKEQVHSAADVRRGLGLDN